MGRSSVLCRANADVPYAMAVRASRISPRVGHWMETVLRAQVHVLDEQHGDRNHRLCTLQHSGSKDTCVHDIPPVRDDLGLLLVLVPVAGEYQLASVRIQRVLMTMPDLIRLSAAAATTQDGRMWVLSMCVHGPPATLIEEVYSVTEQGLIFWTSFAADDRTERDGVWAGSSFVSHRPIPLEALDLPDPQLPPDFAPPRRGRVVAASWRRWCPPPALRAMALWITFGAWRRKLP